MKGRAIFPTGQLLGTVLAVQANFYRVRIELEDKQGSSGNYQPDIPTDLLTPGPVILCTRRTRLKKIGQQVMVGDRVRITEADLSGGRGAIESVFPRQSQLDRPAIANVNQVLLVFAVADPPLEPYQLSKFLIKAESTGLDVILCLNKSDLVSQIVQQEIGDRLRGWGYQPLLISLTQGSNLDQAATRLYQRTTVVAGPSGVGKSSLINRLIPDVQLRVGEVSGKLARGRHTTRHVELFALPSGGLLADTPGFNQPDLDCTPTELVHYFPEARKRLALASCRFSDCLHRDEPDCVVRGDWERYSHYLEFLTAAIARLTQLNQQSDAESTTKLKSKSKGESQYEPKLESKKYRRVARKTQLQALDDLYQERDE